MITYVAIKTKNVKAVLKLIDEYFRKNYEFNIGEIRIAGRNTNFTKGKKNFKNWQDYSDRIQLIRMGNILEIDTDFDVFFNLEENRDWIILDFPPWRTRREHIKIRDYKNIAKFISNKLSLPTLMHIHNDTTGFYHIVLFTKGVLEDELLFDDIVVRIKQGYFENFSNEVYDDTEKFFDDIYIPYLNKWKFDPEAEELQMMTPETWRRFYLDGDIDKLTDYLESS